MDKELWTMGCRLGDVIFCTAAIANLYGIDLERIIRTKESMNRSRYPSPVAFEENRQRIDRLSHSF